MKQNARHIYILISLGLFFAFGSMAVLPKIVSAAADPVVIYNSSTDSRDNASCDSGSVQLSPPYAPSPEFSPTAYYCAKNITQTNSKIEPASNGRCPDTALFGYDGGPGGKLCVTSLLVPPSVLDGTSGSSLPSSSAPQACSAETGASCIEYQKDDGSYNGVLNCSSQQLTSGDCIKGYVNVVIKLLGGAAVLVITAMIIIGGIQYAASGGDPSAVAAAKKRIVNAILALLAFIFMGSLLNFLVPGGIF